MKRVLVTGMSRGLGLEFVRHAMASREDVSICGICRTVSDELSELMGRYPDRIRHFRVDLRDSYRLDEKLGTLFAGDCRIDAFLDNAGTFTPCLIPHLNEANVDEMVRVNLLSPMVLSKCVVRHFIRHKIKGSMVHVSSVAAHVGFRATSVYAATKGGLEAFSRSIAREWGGRGIRSNVVALGLLDIGMRNVVRDDWKEKIDSAAVLGRPTDVMSVVELLDYLLSERSGSVTGQTFHVNSGVSFT